KWAVSYLLWYGGIETRGIRPSGAVRLRIRIRISGCCQRWRVLEKIAKAPGNFICQSETTHSKKIRIPPPTHQPHGRKRRAASLVLFDRCHPDARTGLENRRSGNGGVRPGQWSDDATQ